VSICSFLSIPQSKKWVMYWNHLTKENKWQMSHLKYCYRSPMVKTINITPTFRTLSSILTRISWSRSIHDIW
jgi:hypothetical protein